MVDESLLEYLKQNLKKSSPPFQGGVPEGGGGLNKYHLPEGGGGSKSSSPDLGEVSEGRRGLNNLPHLKTFRKELRKNLTPAEAKLWSLLKGKQLGRKFRRQFSVGNYILDFYCPSENLAIELDGQGHFEATQAEYDAERDLFLLHTGIKVLRFENKLVWDNPEGVLEEIKKNFGWRAKNPSVLRTAPLEGEQLLETRLRDLLSYSENPNPFNEEETQALIEAINNCKILDPACGSGAFPMGILHKMVHMLQKLDPNNAKWKAQQKEKIIGNKIKELEKDKKAIAGLSDKAVREKAIQAVDERLKEIDEIFESQNNFDDYARKLYLIENCIYGIDIQPIAVQIAKLRFFISLVIDQKVDKSKENFGVRSLPNLETKFVAANTLIGLDKPPQLTIRNPKIDEKEKALKDLRHAYFTKNTRNEKLALQRKDQQLRKEIAALLEADGWPSTVAKQVADFDPYDQNTSAKWFDPEWMFGVTSGFDIVIGNPPYVKEYTNRKAFDGLRNSPYYQGKMDLWYIFACKGLDLTKKETGILCFIATNNWTTNAGASKMRNKIIADATIISLLDFGSYKIFESADIQTMVMIFKNSNKSDNYNFELRRLVGKNISYDDVMDLISKKETEKTEFLYPRISRKNLKDKTLTFSKVVYEDILDRIKVKGNITLNENEVANGIHPHFDYVSKATQKILGDSFRVGQGIFVLSNEEKESLNLTKKELELIKPYYTTKQLSKWFGNPNNDEWIIYTDSKFKYAENIKPYPNIKRHLDKFQKIITSDNKPYGLHRARDEYFFKGEKIIALRKCANEPIFTYTDFDCYVSATFYVIKTERINQKYLTAVLNSKLIAFWLQKKGKMQGNNYQLDKGPLLEIPIYNPSQSEQLPIIKLVDQIISLKKQNPQADISSLEKQIDELVYKLYGLTEEEVRIVEGK
jgi:very-short-patch-repair endonuclease